MIWMHQHGLRLMHTILEMELCPMRISYCLINRSFKHKIGYLWHLGSKKIIDITILFPAARWRVLLVQEQSKFSGGGNAFKW